MGQKMTHIIILQCGRVWSSVVECGPRQSKAELIYYKEIAWL